MNQDLENDLEGKYPDWHVLKRLLSYLRPHSAKVVFSLILLLFVSMLNLTGPYLTKLAIDEHIQKSDYSGLDFLAVVYAVSLALSFVCQFLQHYTVQTLGQKVMSDLRMQVFEHLQKMSFRFFDQNPIGKLVTRVVNDVEVLNEMLTSGLIMIFSDVFTLMGIWVVLWFLDWRLMLVVSLITPFLYWATHLYRVRAKDALRKNRTHVSSVNSLLEENLAGMTTVQLFNYEEKRYRDFSEKNKEKLKEDLRSLHYNAVYLPSIDLFSAIGLGLVIWYGGGQNVQGTIELGVLIAFLQYLIKFFEPVRDLAEKFNIIQTAMASAERIFELLDNKNEIPNVRDPYVPQNVAKGSIRFDKVFFAYDKDRTILKNVSFAIDAGESLAIVGATGSGKTTLIHTLFRFYEKMSGDIYIDDVAIEKWDKSALREQMAWVQQDVVLFSGTIRDNLCLAKPDLSDVKVKEIAVMTHCDGFIENKPSQYEEPLTDGRGGLSVGQRQLLSFARALAKDPRILILDEATSSVDLETESNIQQAMEKLIENRTAIIIAHRLSTLKKVDKVLVLKNGEIVEFGQPSQLMRSRGVYYNLMKRQ